MISYRIKIHKNHPHKTLLPTLRLTLISTLILLLTTTTPTIATSNQLSDDTLNKLYDAGAYYYNPDGGCIPNGASPTTTGTIAGNSNAEKVWNYFVTLNLPGLSDNPAAIAGIIGNLQQESGIDPFNKTKSGTYRGLYQTDSPAVIAATNAISGGYWHTDGQSNTATQEVTDAAMQKQLDMLVTNQVFGQDRFKMYVDAIQKYSSIPKDANGAAIYAELFVVAIERAINGNQPLQSTEAQNLTRDIGIGSYANKLWQDVIKRRAYAAEAFNTFSSSTPSTIDGFPAPSSACNVGGSPYTGDGIPQYYQCDPQWGGYHYSINGIHNANGTPPPTTLEGMKAIGDSICNTGCGPTSFAMMATVLLGQEILPSDTTDFAGRQGMHVSGSGSSWQVTGALANHYGLQYEELDTCNVDTINQYLRSGWMIHASGQGSPPFTPNGHYIGITSVNENGDWFVADSASHSRPNQFYSSATVVNNMRCSNVKAIKKGF